MYTRREFLQRVGATTLSLGLVGGRQSFDDAALIALQRDLSPADGVLLLPGTDAYEAHRRGFNLRLEAWPAAILLARAEAGVQRACAWSRDSGRPLLLRAGGHSYETYYNGSALLLDTSAMNGVEIDRRDGLVRVGAGAHQRPVQLALAQKGFVLSGGTCATVGLAGLALGGGYGVTTRRFGLLCDNLAALRLVDAHGTCVNADEQTNDDLLWASRGGGGGNFGAVTRLTFRVQRVDHVIAFSLQWPVHMFGAVLGVWQRAAPAMDDAANCRLIVNASANGVEKIWATGFYTMDPDEDAKAAEAALLRNLAPLRAVGTPDVELVKQSLGEAMASLDASTAPVYFKGKSDYANEPLDREGIQALERALTTWRGDALAMLFTPGGGAMGRVDRDATAFAHRGALFSVQYYCSWHEGANTAFNVAAMRQLYAPLRPYFSGDAYVNYCDFDLENWQSAYYGDNYARLQAIKRRVDPDNFFSNQPQSIRA